MPVINRLPAGVDVPPRVAKLEEVVVVESAKLLEKSS